MNDSGMSHANARFDAGLDRKSDTKRTHEIEHEMEKDAIKREQESTEADVAACVDIPGQDIDPQETQEWLDAFRSLLAYEGKERAKFILKKLAEQATQSCIPLPYSVNTPYRNTIDQSQELPMPGDGAIERKIRSIVRWNALAMVMRANQKDSSIGGHISTFSSIATLYDVGMNHFFHAENEKRLGDLIFWQGHSSPGIYARSFVEGYFTEEHLDRFRHEVDGDKGKNNGLSSYPHPWLMPDYWQFPTVSMGLGPMQAIYQAHFMRYLESRALIPQSAQRKVWAFIGDGETDEPETLGGIALAGREKLDNLIFVVNCNLQRLDGPVRGNGKIIQELEGQFRGAGWNVIKLVWGDGWDQLLAQDVNGLLQECMDKTVDGEYQNYKNKGGAYTRKHFFGQHPELLRMVEHLSDAQIGDLNRGGHDPAKIYNAYLSAMHHADQPTVILAKTVKGYGTGSGESDNVAHSIKKLDITSLKYFRDKFAVPIADEQLEELPYYRPAADSPEIQYLQKQRKQLGGHIPQRRTKIEALLVPDMQLFANQLKGTGDREVSSTMAFVRILASLVKDQHIGKRIVPIVPDEARTFGMEGMFKQLGIYTSEGQKYVPQDADQIISYHEDKRGQILQEGINEAGAISAWIAAGTSAVHHNFATIPFYIFYSMFGFQRVGDLSWLAGDIQARGFLIGATSGRTTLAGEGLQHLDGHSHVLAATIPNCVSYDPTYAYELAVIIRHGLEVMYGRGEARFFYITTMNENYRHPAMPDHPAITQDIVQGIYLLREQGKKSARHQVYLMGSGAILREVEAAAQILAEDYQVRSTIWSATSFNELARDGRETERWNMLHPESEPQVPFVTRKLQQALGKTKSGQVPAIAATDYIRAYADQIRHYVPLPYYVLGTDGFGRSDSRKNLRRFFEVDRYYIAVAALKALADLNKIDKGVVTEAMQRFAIPADKSFPLYS